MIYQIVGTWSNCSPEILDETECKTTAVKLVREYRIAFGNSWTIKIKKAKKINQ